MNCSYCHNERVIDKDVQVQDVGAVATLVACPECSHCTYCDASLDHENQDIVHDPQGGMMHRDPCWWQLCAEEGWCVVCGRPVRSKRFNQCGCVRE